MDGMAKWMEGRSVDRWLAARKLIKYRKYTRVSSKRKKTGTVVVVVVGEEIRRRLAMGPDAEDLRAERGRKPSLQSRLQSGRYHSEYYHFFHDPART